MYPTDDGKIRIVFFSDAAYTGGAERYLHLLAAHLDRSRFESVLVQERRPEAALLKRWMEEDGIVVHEIGPAGPVFRLASLVRLLRRLRPRILHMNLPGPFDCVYGLAAPAARLAGVPHVIGTEHLPMVPTFLKARILKGFSTAFFDRVVTVSEDNRYHLVRIHRTPDAKIRVVHNGLPELPVHGGSGVRRQCGFPEGAFVAAVVGALERRKGHRYLLEAMTGMDDLFHLLVVGAGELGEELRRRAEELRVIGRVHFLGYRGDVPSILADSDLLVAPSTLEATPYVIIEAMAAGVPVVASRIFGIPELVVEEETGLLVEPGDAGALAAAMRRLRADKEERRLMGRAARSRFENEFTIERSVRATERVYGELIGYRGGKES